MNSILLQLTAIYLTKILYILAIIFFFKGHNNPGGGFIAGLMVASGIMLNMLANGVSLTIKSLVIKPIQLIIIGLSIALISSILPIIFHKPFFTGLWLPDFSLPLLGTLHLGTPMLFDLGVFLTVIGFTVSIIFDLEETN